MSTPPPNPAANTSENSTEPPRLKIVLALIGTAGLVGAAFVAGVIPEVGKRLDNKAAPSVTASSAKACPGPSEPRTRAEVVPARVPGVGEIGIKSVVYSLKDGKTDTAPQMFIELTGQLSGQLPADQVLYPFLWADPETRDSTPEHNPGSGRYFWGRTVPVIPDRHGCWSQPQRLLAYAGAHGLHFRLHLGLIPRAQVPCLERLVSSKQGHEHGQTQDELTGCNVTLLGYALIPTRPY
ncbi:hypothetical protein ACSNOI_35485 [Actinomadura kijaniata]|uniref:hypothetical protein n=1 Tax=Actinomadura kijaniata TaxID=46161 RepID=UPI003F1AA9AD